jgi:hypothetical protein
LPQVNLSSSTYADLLFYPDPNHPPTFIERVKTQINSARELFELDIGPCTISDIGNYQVQVSLEND